MSKKSVAHDSRELTAFPDKPDMSFIINKDAPSLFVDRVVVGARQDGMHVLHFISDVAGHPIEQARVIIHKDHFKRMISAMAKNAGFYPSPEADVPDTEEPAGL